MSEVRLKGMENPIRKLYGKLTALKTYTPSEEVNGLFVELVRLALGPDDKNTLTAEEMDKLQVICGTAEYELEKYWAEKIVRSDDPKGVMEDFPYMENYQKLTRMEWFSLLSCEAHEEHGIFFAGGGPLPLTAILLARDYGQKVTVADIDADACDFSMRLVKALGLDKKITVINADAAEYEGYGGFNVIIVAALAGLEKGMKGRILGKIKKHALRGAHVLARSSWGMRELLYRPLEPEACDGFKRIIEVRPRNDVVNSIVIFKNS